MIWWWCCCDCVMGEKWKIRFGYSITAAMFTNIWCGLIHFEIIEIILHSPFCINFVLHFKRMAYWYFQNISKHFQFNFTVFAFVEWKLEVRFYRLASHYMGNRSILSYGCIMGSFQFVWWFSLGRKRQHCWEWIMAIGWALERYEICHALHAN